MMTAQHVGAAGAANTARHQASAQALLDANCDLEEFAAVATSVLPGTNVDYEKVERFHTASAIIDARALGIARAGGDAARGLADFAAKSWSPRREAFEDLWVNGRAFIYFAANPGTLGATDYGDLCLVIRADRLLELRRRVERQDLAVIHDRHAVTKLVGFFHVVRGEQDRLAGVVQLPEQVP